VINVRGPLLVLVLEKEDAVDVWRDLLGPMDLEVAQIEAPDRLVHRILAVVELLVVEH